ncbi:fatty acyl-CoA reductase 3-like [Neltuma alba]|uniref:fatty acyl-CoA reductase 3-like n=1 Tax=Neltuma alba TaxID=207710 RepID=UPI0010A51591|nr:fatty acyl-CoA reductase 3-like [Prosopis alba]
MRIFLFWPTRSCRFDVAMNVNTMGALNVLNFAKRCQKIQVLLHVSTAYVCGEAKDKEVIREEPFKMGRALKKVAELDIHAELGFMKKRTQQLEEENADAKAISAAMKDYGLKRANLYGWPNTYVLTKALGEMFLSHLKDQIPLVIIRPTMVTSTYKEPFPGWIEGFRTVDAVIGGYAKGKLTCFPGNPKTILDLIPADIVVNCMMAAMANHSNEASENYTFHVCSSSRNPFRLSSLPNILSLYFKNNPLTTKNGKPLMIRSKATLASNAHFHMYLLIQYLLPLTGLNLANKVLCGGFQDAYSGNHRKIKMLTRMAELYKPYVFSKATFDDSNTEKLRKATKCGRALEVLIGVST